MLIDKKREEMYFNCRMRKKELDKRIAIIRAVLVIPPVLIFIFTAALIIMSMLGDAAVLATGAGFYGYMSAGVSAMYLIDLVSCAALTFMALSVTVFRTEWVLERAVMIYSVLVFALAISLALFGYFPIITYILLSAIAIPLTIYAKKLIEEDTRMSMLDGYPHFNPMLMKHTDTPFVPATKSELDGMTPEERIMYEREH